MNSALHLYLKTNNKLCKFTGKSFGATVDRTLVGELVFQTGMTGYMQNLSDPSYQGQFLVMTYPMIGNYATNEEIQSDTKGPRVLIVRDIDSQNQNLSEWMKHRGCVGLSGIPTRKLTEIIRNNKSKEPVFGLITIEELETEQELEQEIVIPKSLPISNHEFPQYYGNITNPKYRILMIDCGCKKQQINLLLKRGAGVYVLPYSCVKSYDIASESSNFDGVMLSSGPHDPQIYCDVIELIRQIPETMPIFGICLGNQLMALAHGAKTYRMEYGNRGLNIPVKSDILNVSWITSQNHGYAVTDLPAELGVLFHNLNDNTVEGIYHKTLPRFSVQFHPEASPGPTDSESLYDVFLEMIDTKTPIRSKNNNYTSYNPSTSTSTSNPLKKVIILGSGGLTIGQAGEFDYSGTQALKACKELGVETVLINPNIATVQTTTNGYADRIYYREITPSVVEQVISLEHPDGIIVSVGGQTALNCGMQMGKDLFDKYGVTVVGTSLESIRLTEDRELFAREVIGLGVGLSTGFVAQITCPEDIANIKNELRFPVFIRNGFALGGLGSKVINSFKELSEIHYFPFTIDRNFEGMSEIEYEIMRDANGTCIAVCNMENFDPVGVHTGDSIVIAPSQTLNDSMYQRLRNAAIQLANHFQIVGECNVQFAVSQTQNSEEFYVIEMNARLSRSSALASKATGYPLAYISTLVGLGKSLDSLRNSLTNTSAFFEPSMDYCVVKMPRWDMSKFESETSSSSSSSTSSAILGSSMKSIGEAMAIGATFEEALQKSIRMVGNMGEGINFNCNCTLDLSIPTPDRIHRIATALKSHSLDVEEIHNKTFIHKWFLNRIKNIVEFDFRVQLDSFSIRTAKILGFSDKQIASKLNTTETAIRCIRWQENIVPSIMKIDSVAGEFPCHSSYQYLTYGSYDEPSTSPSPPPSPLPTTQHTTHESVLILGSGVYHIGSSVEFDWSAVGVSKSLRELGKKTIMLNCNPETVSTDFDENDQLIFENVDLETVMDISHQLNLLGVVVSVGGQKANNIVMKLYRQGVPILGTSPEMIDRAENRYKFSRMLDNINVTQPQWKELTSLSEVIAFCEAVGYPCLIRPSYVLSGESMRIVFSKEDLTAYLDKCSFSEDFPVVISKFIIEAKEIEVDAIGVNGDVKFMAISEHVENAGVHSGDATIIIPAQDLTELTLQNIREASIKICKELSVTGPFNIQFIAKNDQVEVIECNLRASRSFPFVSKALNVNLTELIAKAIIGTRIEAGAGTGAGTTSDLICVKVPQFSFHRLPTVDSILGVEMMSTGEVAGFGHTLQQAFLKGLLATGMKIPSKPNLNVLVSIGSQRYKAEFEQSMKELVKHHTVWTTSGTGDYYRTSNNIDTHRFKWGSIESELKANNIELVINVPMLDRVRNCKETPGYHLRMIARKLSILTITDIKLAKLLVSCLNNKDIDIHVDPAVDAKNNANIIRIPIAFDPHVHIREPGQEYKEDWESGSKAALAGGIGIIGVMPNLVVPITTEAILDNVVEIAKSKSVVEFGIFLGATESNWDKISQVANSHSEVIGLKLYLCDTFHSRHMSDESIRQHFLHWNCTKPIVIHADLKHIAMCIGFAFTYKRRLHIAHIATVNELDLVNDARRQGLSVTCEVTPHHLLLGCNIHVKPPIQSTSNELLERLHDIDIIATDHAPHLETEASSCPGVAGLETCLTLMIDLVNRGKLTINRLIEMTHFAPLRIFNVKSNISDFENNYVEIDINHRHRLTHPIFSKCRWSPFAGMEVTGKIKKVVIDGKDAMTLPLPLPLPLKGPLKTIVATNSTATATTDISTSTAVSTSTSTSVSTSQKSLQDTFVRQPLPPSENEFYKKSIVSCSQFTKKNLRELFDLATSYRLGTNKELDPIYPINPTNPNNKNKKPLLLGLLFLEPSTRTVSSFTAAAHRLGINVINPQIENSSMCKGETIDDTVKTLSCYCDAVVLRSNIKGICDKLSKNLDIPIINAGDGTGEHPTQALLDIYTIREERGSLHGLTIAFVGDLKNGRTVHSLIKLLCLYSAIKIQLISHQDLQLPEEYLGILTTAKIPYQIFDISDIEKAIETSDVLYATRIQKERMKGESTTTTTKYDYKINNHVLKSAKPNLVIMHPLPRVTELDPEIDTDPRSAYFRQMNYGMYIRMALLTKLFSEKT